MQKYVLGFIFDKEENNILLIQKERPYWQKGLWNGIGGKIESFDQNPLQAIQREVLEETNLTIQDWKHFAILTDEQFFHIECFKANIDLKELQEFQTMTDERVFIKEIRELYHEKFSSCISNLNWLIALCLDKDVHKISSYIHYGKE
jgi:8-oxo-dGTP diphosphatase